MALVGLKEKIKRKVNVYKNVAKIKVMKEVEIELLEYYEQLCNLEVDLFHIQTTDPVRLHGYEYENKRLELYDHINMCEKLTGHKWDEFEEMIPAIADYHYKNYILKGE